MTPLSITDVATKLARQEDAGLHLDFVVGEWSARLRTNSQELLALLSAYLRPFVRAVDQPTVTITAYASAVPALPDRFEHWKRDPGKSGLKEEVCDLDGGWVVRKVRTGMHFFLGSGVRTIVGPCVKNFIQVVNFLNVEYMAWLMRQDWVLCHAAGVCSESGKGLGLAGVSGAGKSTLALHMMNTGAYFVSNDRLLISPEAPHRISGVPKHPRINPGTALNNERLLPILSTERKRELELMDKEDLWQLEEKLDADIVELYDGRWKIGADLSAFVLLNWHRNNTGPVVCKEIDFGAREDLWPTVLKTPGPLWVGPNETRAANTPTADPRDYLRVMSQIPVYEISGKADFARAVEICLGMIR